MQGQTISIGIAIILYTGSILFGRDQLWFIQQHSVSSGRCRIAHRLSIILGIFIDSTKQEEGNHGLEL
ncbi:hypothetical protein [Desulfosporosinus sp.]|uniref:hypothetical protein n=1 Tax=Desulfosporosinus sp. TaxID=157907 RepID=UPI00262F2C1E|nr:hypothetical protein [Desulfosporosinus sp.]